MTRSTSPAATRHPPSAPAGQASTLSDDGFRAWVGPHLPVMVGLARRLAADDADDVVQDALLTAWRQQHLFDENRATARSWLLTLVANAASRTWRTRRRHPVDLRLDLPEPAVHDAPVDVDLHRALKSLPARQRLAVALVYYLDLPLREAADVMDCAEGTVKSTLADARARLRKKLEEK